MKFLSTIPNRSIASLFVLVVLLAGCSKEECVAPSDRATEVAKSLHPVPSTGEPMNGVLQPGSVKDGGNSSISDDGDDVGDGERNKKKKPG
ncbi:MAG: hypothetical protein IT226_15120 [Flavobacteriales bacterium]|nr:hypothetical protein [Flavobacteriales bacterium]